LPIQFISVSYDSHNKQRLFPQTALMGWTTECVSCEVGTEALHIIEMCSRLQPHLLTAKNPVEVARVGHGIDAS
jgi:hypothetical protein